MKIFKIASFSLLGLLCLSMTRAAHAQWSIGPGTYTATPSPSIGGYSISPGYASCGASLIYFGTLNVSYTTKLHWMGDLPATQGAMILVGGGVDGRTTNPNGAATVTATSIATAFDLQVKGATANGSVPFSAKPTDQTTKGPLYKQDLTATLYLQCTCDPMNGLAQSNRANAQVSFTLQ